jgi:hypothetical protein
MNSFGLSKAPAMTSYNQEAHSGIRNGTHYHSRDGPSDDLPPETLLLQDCSIRRFGGGVSTALLSTERNVVPT